MIAVLWILGILFLLFVLLEIGCRLYHMHRYGIPFHSKVVGEYPYSQFVERVDPPLHYRFRKGFRSPMVNINRFHCRGKEPAADGAKKRILVIGESMYFGVKILNEEDLWSNQLERLLKLHGYTDWEVINAGNPMYNTVQHRAFWEQVLRRVQPDILLLNMGGNDLTQAWMMGSQWTPGAPWPWKFIMALERRSPWWNKILSHFCFYFLLRRKTMTARQGFIPQDDTFKEEECQRVIWENLRSIADDAKKNGTKVGILSFGVAVDLVPRPEDERKLDAIQANWKEHSEGNMGTMIKYFEALKEEFCPKFDLPYIDMQEAFRRNPRRFECYFDLGHWNKRGMRWVAKTLFEELYRLGWLDMQKSQPKEAISNP